MSTVEPVILEDVLLDHLAVPESAMVLFRERISPDLIPDSDAGVREALEFVLGHIQQYGEPPTPEVIAAETGWQDLRTPVVPIDYVIEKFRERYARRELNRLMKQMGRSAKDPTAALEIGFREITRVRWETMRRSTISSTRDGGLLTRYDAHGHRGRGFTFGWEDVDSHLGGGMQVDELYFGLGRPKRGKSWLWCVKPAVEGLKQGKSSVLFSLELSKTEMLDRIICMVAGVSYQRFKDRCLQPAERDLVADAEEWMQDIDAQVHVLKPDGGSRSVPVLVQTAREFDPEVVFIDQLSYVEHTDPPPTPQWQSLHTTCRQLKEATKYWPIMVAAQLNREADGLQEMADLAHIALGEGPGQTADLLLGLHANKEMKKQGILEYGVIEARNLGGYPRWHVKNDLTINSNYRLLKQL